MTLPVVGSELRVTVGDDGSRDSMLYEKVILKGLGGLRCGSALLARDKYSLIRELVHSNQHSIVSGLFCGTQ